MKYREEKDREKIKSISELQSKIEWSILYVYGIIPPKRRDE